MTDKPRGLGPNQLKWCRKWITRFADAEGNVLSSEAHAQAMREKIGEPTVRQEEPKYGAIGSDVAPKPPGLVSRIIDATRR